MEYKVTFVGPDGYIDLSVNDKEEALDIAGNLLEAYHDVQIELVDIE